MKDKYKSLEGCFSVLAGGAILILVFGVLAGVFRIVFPIIGMDASTRACLGWSGVVTAIALAQAIALKIVMES
jgi:hypothetical protein